MCYRRFLRKQVLVVLIVLFIGLWFLMKSKSFRIINQQHLVKDRLNTDRFVVDPPEVNNQQEMERLLKVEDIITMRKKEEDQIRQENLEMIKKYNESLKLQEIEDDAFNPIHLVESKYTDFSNFKINFTETRYKPEDLRDVVHKLNTEQIIYNLEKIDKLPKDFVVVVVQVHKRVEYFKELLDSLQRSKGIEGVLLVVSHDYYTDEMNALIRMIKFCPVVQIFFPYSLQLFPEEFPGPSKNDCPRDIKKDEARRQGCINAETPDMYGHYREAPIVMIKHHWWWKINMVMDVLDKTKNHDGPFLFVEEDHYVAPSFIHALKTLQNFRKSDGKCRNSCQILTLGTYNNKQNFQQEGKRVMRGPWISSQHNMGMALFRDTWRQLKSCAKAFCTFDDYNWDWTLMHISNKCLQKPLVVLLYEVPRIFHVGDCGLHHKKSCTSTKDTLNRIKGIIERNKDYLYTDRIETYDKAGSINTKPNGGWGDSRDHELCLRYIQEEDPL